MTPKSSSTRPFDVAIIGTGLYGIQAARYYLDIHPDSKIVLLEADDVVGGTWSSNSCTDFVWMSYDSSRESLTRLSGSYHERVYDAFWTQTPIRMAEFSDRPMTPPPIEDQYYGFFPARYTTQYLEEYVDSHVYSGQSIRDRVLFGCRVQHVEKGTDRLWTISYNDDSSLQAIKLIDASGLTSQPYIPHIEGIETYQGLAIHHKSFGQSTFLTDPSKKHIVVLGGAKSAADVAYASAKAPGDKTVSWIIRENGSGPAAFFGAQPMSKKYANSNEGFYNRFMASFLPNPFGRKGWLAWILHGTRIGRHYVMQLWDGFDRGLRSWANFERAEGKSRGFGNLEPDTPIFWQNDSSGVNVRPDFFETIATKVHVYRQDIDHMSADTIHLSPRNGSKDQQQTIRADVLVYCTGWAPFSQIFESPDASDFGLAVPRAHADPKNEAHWQYLEEIADTKILARFPHLARPPPYHKAEPTHTPFRLYKAMIPVTEPLDHSIAFLDKMVVGNNFRTAEVQALWAVAYLDGKIKVDPGQMEEDVAMTVAWNRRRYLNKGQLGSWFYFDVVAYTDMLLEELGLSSHRKKGLVGNLMDPCFAGDLKNLASEYKNRMSLSKSS